MTDPKDIRLDPEVLRRQFMSSDIPPVSDKPLDSEAPTEEKCVACATCSLCRGTGLTTRPRNRYWRDEVMIGKKK